MSNVLKDNVVAVESKFNTLFVKRSKKEGLELIHPLMNVYCISKDVNNSYTCLFYSSLTGRVATLDAVRNKATYSRMSELLNKANMREMYLINYPTNVEDMKNHRLMYEEVRPYPILTYEELKAKEKKGELNLNFMWQYFYDSSKRQAVMIKSKNHLDSLKAYLDIYFKHFKGTEVKCSYDSMRYVLGVFDNYYNIKHQKFQTFEERLKELEAEEQVKEEANRSARIVFNHEIEKLNKKWSKFGLDLTSLVSFETTTLKQLEELDARLHESINYTCGGKRISEEQYKAIAHGLRF